VALARPQDAALCSPGRVCALQDTHLILEVLVDLPRPHHVAQQHDLGRRPRDGDTLRPKAGVVRLDTLVASRQVTVRHKEDTLHVTQPLPGGSCEGIIVKATDGRMLG